MYASGQDAIGEGVVGLVAGQGGAGLADREEAAGGLGDPSRSPPGVPPRGAATDTPPARGVASWRCVLERKMLSSAEVGVGGSPASRHRACPGRRPSRRRPGDWRGNRPGRPGRHRPCRTSRRCRRRRRGSTPSGSPSASDTSSERRPEGRALRGVEHHHVDPPPVEDRPPDALLAVDKGLAEFAATRRRWRRGRRPGGCRCSSCASGYARQSKASPSDRLVLRTRPLIGRVRQEFGRLQGEVVRVVAEAEDRVARQ